jgi:hypothetical protein
MVWAATGRQPATMRNDRFRQKSKMRAMSAASEPFLSLGVAKAAKFQKPPLTSFIPPSAHSTGCARGARRDAGINADETKWNAESAQRKMTMNIDARGPVSVWREAGFITIGHSAPADERLGL